MLIICKSREEGIKASGHFVEAIAEPDKVKSHNGAVRRGQNSGIDEGSLEIGEDKAGPFEEAATRGAVGIGRAEVDEAAHGSKAIKGTGKEPSSKRLQNDVEAFLFVVIKSGEIRSVRNLRRADNGLF